MLNGLNHITLAVSNVDKSLQFYCEVLDFKGHVKWDKGAYLSLGDLWLCLSLDKPDVSSDYTHYAFDIDSDKFTEMASRIAEHQIPQWKQNKSEGQSLYLLDPDGHKLELHVGGLAQRLASLKQQPYAGLTWL